MSYRMIRIVIKMLSFRKENYIVCSKEYLFISQHELQAKKSFQENSHKMACSEIHHSLEVGRARNPQHSQRKETSIFFHLIFLHSTN